MGAVEFFLLGADALEDSPIWAAPLLVGVRYGDQHPQPLSFPQERKRLDMALDAFIWSLALVGLDRANKAHPLSAPDLGRQAPVLNLDPLGIPTETDMEGQSVGQLDSEPVDLDGHETDHAAWRNQKPPRMYLESSERVFVYYRAIFANQIGWRPHIVETDAERGLPQSTDCPPHFDDRRSQREVNGSGRQVCCGVRRRHRSSLPQFRRPIWNGLLLSLNS